MLTLFHKAAVTVPCRHCSGILTFQGLFITLTGGQFFVLALVDEYQAGAAYV